MEGGSCDVQDTTPAAASIILGKGQDGIQTLKNGHRSRSQGVLMEG